MCAARGARARRLVATPPHAAQTGAGDDPANGIVQQRETLLQNLIEKYNEQLREAKRVKNLPKEALAARARLGNQMHLDMLQGTPVGGGKKKRKQQTESEAGEDLDEEEAPAAETERKRGGRAVPADYGADQAALIQMMKEGDAARLEESVLKREAQAKAAAAADERAALDREAMNKRHAEELAQRREAEAGLRGIEKVKAEIEMRRLALQEKQREDAERAAVRNAQQQQSMLDNNTKMTASVLDIVAKLTEQLNKKS